MAHSAPVTSTLKLVADEEYPVASAVPDDSASAEPAAATSYGDSGTPLTSMGQMMPGPSVSENPAHSCFTGGGGTQYGVSVICA